MDEPYGKQCYLSALELIHCIHPLFCCLLLWTTVRLHGKKLQNATKVISQTIRPHCVAESPALLQANEKKDHSEKGIRK